MDADDLLFELVWGDMLFLNCSNPLTYWGLIRNVNRYVYSQITNALDSNPLLIM